jgi:hypothetical protein
LTPHRWGWAKGIEPYRAWVKEHVHRVCPVPDHVRRGLGFRTVWMCRGRPGDPDDAVWKFSDLVKLAQESKSHGLDEMVLWFTHPHFELPTPSFHEHLGGDREFVKAVAECKRLGVNVVPFISVCIAIQKTAGAYGAKHFNTNYTYHPETIPRMNPPYAGSHLGAMISTTHPVWQRQVLTSCKRWIDMGIPSLSWDQYFIEPREPNLLTLTRQIRAHARKRDPQSTFSAEELRNIEISCDYLDYTWNWDLARDYQPMTSVFPAPRINVNIDTSPAEVKHYFAQNRYLNVEPRKPDDINGSDLIENHSELSKALKQCATLRVKFLPYFLDGHLIGDCILREPCAQALVTAYVLPDKILVIAVNQGPAQKIVLRCDPQAWLASASGRYAVKSYDGAGRLLETADLPADSRQLTTPVLENLDIALFELLPR